MSRFPKAIILSVLAALLFLPRLGETCGPFFSAAIFARLHGPDRPLEDFARGKIGVVLPDWNVPYRVVAYRYLLERPLSATEQQSLIDHYNTERRIEPPDRWLEALKDWTSARSEYAKQPAQDDLEMYAKTPSGFTLIPNCLAPAFVTAVATLKDRANRFGSPSADLQEWISGQDAVFSNCGGSGRTFPPELPTTANPLLRADRAYQIAAAHFYAGEKDYYETALKQFQAIAEDKSSPWHSIASYLVARTLIRQASMAAEPDQAYYLLILAKAEVQLEAILKDPDQQAMHEDATTLLGLVEYRLHPEQREAELGKLLAEGAGIHFGQDLVDYVWLGRRPSSRHTQDDLSAWLSEGGSPNGAIDMWRSTHSMPWLVAVLWQLKPTDPAFKEAMKAAVGVPPTSAAYATVAYSRVRLARESGDDELARQVLSAVLQHRKALPLSALHLFQDEQMQVVKDYETFESRLWQNPIEYDDGVNEIVPCVTAKSPGCGPQLSPAAATLLNTRIPIELFARLAQSPTFPADLHRRIAPAAWARAALLDQASLATQAAKAAGDAEPALKPYLARYSEAPTPEERKFAAVFAILHFPGLRPYVDGPYPRLTPFQQIDSLRDNWWFADVGSNMFYPNFEKTWEESARALSQPATASGSTPALTEGETTGPMVTSTEFPAILDKAERQRGAAEWRELHALGSASRYLPRVVIDWGKKHPSDPRVPEALHLAIRAMRYGSSNEWSREAFTLLHKNYPNSEWAKQTPYWFK